MASTTSLKELSKAINAFILRPVTPLPEDLIDTIAAYLRRHQKYDDAASDRLQEELFSIFDKNVKSNPSAAGAWLGILRRLLPVLQTPERIQQWFDACQGMLTRSAQEKGIVNETVAGFMDLFTLADAYQDIAEGQSFSNPIIDRLFDIWMDRLYPGSTAGISNMEHAERMIREALGQFGKKRPKAFFTTLDSYFAQKQYRKAALRFFCDYIQSQPPHLHTVMETPLFGHLLTCLQQDTSVTIISAALTALIMVLPHMPSSLAPHLPTLFNIYARILFWSHETPRAAERAGSDADGSRQWEVCEFSSETDEMSVPHLSKYFTMLYGLYPINFMDYIRKPQRYLRHANVADAEEFEVQPSEIRHQSEKFRRCHGLHPNFYTLTIETEKTDFGRWIKSEAAEVVAECMSLCLVPDEDLGNQYHAPEPGGPLLADGDNFAEKEMPDPALLSTSAPMLDSWRLSRSISADSSSSRRSPSGMVRSGSQASHPSTRDLAELRLKESAVDSPTLPMGLAPSASQTQLQDMIQSNKAVKSGLHQSLANDSVPSLALSQQESAAGGPNLAPVARPFVNSAMSATDSGSQSQLAHLQRHILMLQNDLSFERYLKQQHMAHIGELRRRQMAEAATEAETQNLILMNRSLKSRYEDAKKMEMQVRKDSERSRTMAKKWEADLTAKVKNLRDESKKTAAEIEVVKRELEESKTEAETLRRMVCDAEVKELNRKQNMQSIEIHTAEIDRLKSEVERLSALDRNHQAKELEREVAVNTAADAENKMESMRLSLVAQENEVTRTKTLFQSQITSLQAKLAEAREVSEQQAGRGSSNVGIEHDLAASRAKQAELEKQHSLLLRKYTALQSSLLDLQSGVEPGEVQGVQPVGTGSGGDYLSTSANTVLVRTRPHRGLSDPAATGLGGTAYNVTPPLGWKSTIPPSPGTTQLPRPTTPVTAEPGGNGAPPSPDQRYHGRGGVQNRIRKEGKDKPKDDGNTAGSASGGSKKDKKSSGLRGIRGLV